MRVLRLPAAAALLAAGCSTGAFPPEPETVPMLIASGFRVARAHDGPPPPDLRPGRVSRRIDPRGVQYFYAEPDRGELLTGDEDAFMRYQQLRLARARPDRPAVFVGFSYGAPVGF